MVTDAWLGQLYWGGKGYAKNNLQFVPTYTKPTTKPCLPVCKNTQIKHEIYLITTGEETNLQEIKIILLFLQNKSDRVRHTLHHNN